MLHNIYRLTITNSRNTEVRHVTDTNQATGLKQPLIALIMVADLRNLNLLTIYFLSQTTNDHLSHRRCLRRTDSGHINDIKFQGELKIVMRQKSEVDYTLIITKLL